MSNENYYGASRYESTRGSDRSLLYVIPQEPDTRIALLNVDRRTKEECRIKYGIALTHDWRANTIAYSYVSSVIALLNKSLLDGKNPDMGFNFYDYLSCYITCKQNTDAEKEGNINVAFVIGPKGKELVDKFVAGDKGEDYPEEKITAEAAFSFLDDKAMNDYYEHVDKVAAFTLSEKYSITMRQGTNQAKWIVTAIGVTFLKNLILELMNIMDCTSKPSASINFNDLIEAHAISRAEGVTITLRPGYESKLLIKSDAVTEADEDDDE